MLEILLGCCSGKVQEKVQRTNVPAQDGVYSFDFEKLQGSDRQMPFQVQALNLSITPNKLKCRDFYPFSSVICPQ